MNFDDIGHEVAIVASNQVLCDEHSVNQEVGGGHLYRPKGYCNFQQLLLIDELQQREQSALVCSVG